MTASGGVGAGTTVETGGLATLSQSLAAAGVNGRIAIIGALGGPETTAFPNFSSEARRQYLLV